jgi:TusA-related sulfurtransferase
MVTFDLREKLIPFSLLEITNVFRRMQPGEEMDILAGSCPVEVAIFQDVMRILPRNEYDLISQRDASGKDPVSRLRIRKKNSP